MNSTANFDLTGLEQSDIDGIVALYGANTTDMADAGTGATPPDIAIPDDGTGDTGATPDAPTGRLWRNPDRCGRWRHGRRCRCGPDRYRRARWLARRSRRPLADLASLLNSILEDLGGAGIAPGADVHAAQPVEVSNVALQHIDNHMWG